MGQYYEKKLKQYNDEKRQIKEWINRTTKRTLMLLDIMLVVLVVQLGIILATNENVIEPEDNQYLEFRAVEVKEVEGQNNQVIMELWANNLELKGFDIYFSYDHTKLHPSIIETNEITEEETEYFQFEGEFKDVLELFTIPTGKSGEIRGVVSYTPPVGETEHIVEKEGIGKVIDSKGSVLLGRISFQMTAETFDIGWFKTIEDPTITLNTGVKISQDGTKYYEKTSTLRFTDYKVSPETVRAIEIGKMPKTEYKYGEILSVEGGTIIITKNTEEKEEIELKQSMVQGYDPNKLGEQTLTITYGGKTVTYEITVEDYIKDIRIVKPTKLIYNIGEEKDLTGGTVAAIMASGAETTPISITDKRVQIEGFDTTEKGAKLVKVTYQGFTRGFGITVIEETEGIKLKELPTKTEYLYGEELDVEGGTIEVVNENGEKETIEITKDMVTGYEPEKIGDQTLTIKYKELEIEYIVHVEDYEVSIKVEAPTKIEYEYGEEIDLTGGKVSVIMASGEVKETVELMNYMISGYEKEKLGTQTIQVEHRGLKGEFNVKVVDKIKSISMNKQPDKIEYKYGESLDITGATIRVIKSSGTIIIPITMDMITGYDPTICGTQVITVTYGGCTTEFIVNVDKVADKPIENKPSTDSTIGGNEQSTTQKPVGEDIEIPQEPTNEAPTEEQQEPKEEEPIKTPQEPEEKPTETLGEQDKKDNNEKTKRIVAVILATSGIALIVILIIPKHNVKIYVAKNNEYELVGKDRITKKYPVLDIDKYINEEKYKNEVKIELNKSISKKLDEKEVEITYKQQTTKRKINYENKAYEIYLK